MDETIEMDKDGLFSQMGASYERVEAALAALTPEQWVTPREAGAWSPRDIVAHLTAWLERLSLEMDAITVNKSPQVSIVGLSQPDIDAFNAQSAERHRDETPQQALGSFRRMYGQLSDQVRVLTWDDLSTVGRYEWLGETPLWRLIAEDTWEHFDEHLPEIERAAGTEAR